MLLLLWILLAVAHAETSNDVNLSVDWESFLKRSDLIWEWNISNNNTRPPRGWWGMAFTGNGILGAMVTSDEAPLVVGVGRTDVVDDRLPGTAHAQGSAKCDVERLPIGDFHVNTKGTVISGYMRLDLYRARVIGTLTTNEGKVNFTVFTHALSDINALQVMAFDGESVDITWVPKQGNTSWPSSCHNYVPNPPLQTNCSTDSCTTTQSLLSGATYATVYKTISQQREGNTVITMFSSTIGPHPGQTTASQKASDLVTTATQQGWERLVTSHESWWNSYYPQSFISLTDLQMESFYWATIYKMGSGTRGNIPPPSFGVLDHTGPWFYPSKTCCPLFNWDMNVMVTFWVFPTSNRHNLNDAFVRWISSKQVHTGLVSNVPEEFRSDSLAAPHNIAGFFASSYQPVEPPEYVSNLLWTLVDLWNQYRFTMNNTVLELFYPLLRGAVHHHLHLATEGKDGYLHFEPTMSPEYPSEYIGEGDTTYQLSLFKWGLRTLIKACKLLGKKCPDTDLRPYVEALQKAPPYAVSNEAVGHGGGLMVAKNLSFATSHRHFSHLLPCWNLGELDWGNAHDEEMSLCRKSLLNWVNIRTPDNLNAWDAFSYAGASSFYSRCHQGNEAYDQLRTLFKYTWPNYSTLNNTMSFPWAMQPNTFQGEGTYDPVEGPSHGDPTMETPLAMASAIQDMMLFSDDNVTGTFRVFWGTPTTLKEVYFFNLLAAGGFSVSASRKDGKTQWVSINPSALSDCTVFVDGFDSAQEISVNPTGALSRINKDGSIVLKIPNKQTVLLYQGIPPNTTITPTIGDGNSNWWGEH
eukprot:m.58769 g.58769  ORF g.58769 m.58769 type:complete len:807 (+) comp11199_c0_seq1:36-2456(+)